MGQTYTTGDSNCIGVVLLTFSRVLKLCQKNEDDNFF